MKRVVIMICTLFLITSVLVACTKKTPPISVKIGTSASFPPFESVDYTNKGMVGFDIDLMNAVAAQANLKVEFVNTNYDTLLRDISQCTLDGGIAAIPITETLKKQMLFTDSYITIGQVLVVKQNNNTIKSLSDLAGKTVGVQAGSPGEVEVQKKENIKTKSFQSIDNAFQELTYGLIDAVVTDKPFALTFVNVAANGLKIVGPEFAKQDLAIAMCKQQQDTIDRINTAIRKLKFDGTVEKLDKKWVVTGIQ